MPNWCYNRLEVTGHPRTVARFVEEARDGETPLSFAKHVPVPEEGDSNYMVDKQRRAWGTKWDLDGETDYTPGTKGSPTVYVFSTAWTPPLSWLEVVSEKFPKLTFRIQFYEEGNGFAGEAVFHDGSAETEELESRVLKMRMYGQVEDYCERCNDEYSSTDPVDRNRCDGCWKETCKNCDAGSDEHAMSKCLFKPTRYEPNDPEYVAALVAEAEQRDD